MTDMYLPINPAQAYSSTFSVRTDGLNWASAQVIVTSVTSPAQTFTDGSAATATLTVVSYLGLSTAAATGSLTISSDTALVGGCVSGGGPNVGSFNVCNPANYAVDLVYSSNTACNLAKAIQSFNVVIATCGVSGASVVYTTAPYGGAIWNSFQLASSTAAITVSNLISSSTLGGPYVGSLSGGVDNGSFAINGKTFLANRDFFPMTSTTQTATNIATAIQNSSTTINVTAAASGNIVSATATVVGVTGNTYATAVSSDPALTLSTYISSGTTVANGLMSGGTNSAYTFLGSQISVPGNNFGLAEGVYLSTGSGVTITPLVAGGTYYVIPGVAGSIQLSTTAANALAGLPIVLTSSQTKTTADTFTLNVPATTGTPVTQWVVSNDNTSWFPYTTTPLGQTVNALVSYGTYIATGTVSSVDFGHMDWAWLGLNVTAPATGAIQIKAKLAGDQ